MLKQLQVLIAIFAWWIGNLGDFFSQVYPKAEPVWLNCSFEKERKVAYTAVQVHPAADSSYCNLAQS